MTSLDSSRIKSQGQHLRDAQNSNGLCLHHLRRIGPPATKSGVADVMDLFKVTSLIGRNRNQVDFVLDSSNPITSQYISRLHARIVRQDSNLHRLYDDSLNGIFINNAKIQGSVVLQEGDIITFGHPHGVRLAAGVWMRQPDSEYQFIFEQCSCPETSRKDRPGVLEDKINITPIATNFAQNQTEFLKPTPHLDPDPVLSASRILDQCITTISGLAESLTAKPTGPRGKTDLPAASSSASTPCLTAKSMGSDEISDDKSGKNVAQEQNQRRITEYLDKSAGLDSSSLCDSTFVNNESLLCEESPVKPPHNYSFQIPTMVKNSVIPISVPSPCKLTLPHSKGEEKCFSDILVDQEANGTPKFKEINCQSPSNDNKIQSLHSNSEISASVSAPPQPIQPVDLAADSLCVSVSTAAQITDQTKDIQPKEEVTADIAHVKNAAHIKPMIEISLEPDRMSECDRVQLETPSERKDSFVSAHSCCPTEQRASAETMSENLTASTTVLLTEFDRGSEITDSDVKSTVTFCEEEIHPSEQIVNKKRMSIPTDTCSHSSEHCLSPAGDAGVGSVDKSQADIPCADTFLNLGSDVSSQVAESFSSRGGGTSEQGGTNDQEHGRFQVKVCEPADHGSGVVCHEGNVREVEDSDSRVISGEITSEKCRDREHSRGCFHEGDTKTYFRHTPNRDVTVEAIDPDNRQTVTGVMPTTCTVPFKTLSHNHDEPSGFSKHGRATDVECCDASENSAHAADLSKSCSQTDHRSPTQRGDASHTDCCKPDEEEDKGQIHYSCSELLREDCRPPPTRMANDSPDLLTSVSCDEQEKESGNSHHSEEVAADRAQTTISENVHKSEENDTEMLEDLKDGADAIMCGGLEGKLSHELALVSYVSSHGNSTLRKGSPGSYVENESSVNLTQNEENDIQVSHSRFPVSETPEHRDETDGGLGSSILSKVMSACRDLLQQSENLGNAGDTMQVDFSDDDDDDNEAERNCVANVIHNILSSQSDEDPAEISMVGASNVSSQAQMATSHDGFQETEKVDSCGNVGTAQHTNITNICVNMTDTADHSNVENTNAAVADPPETSAKLSASVGHEVTSLSPVGDVGRNFQVVDTESSGVNAKKSQNDFVLVATNADENFENSEISVTGIALQESTGTDDVVGRNDTCTVSSRSNASVRGVDELNEEIDAETVTAEGGKLMVSQMECSAMSSTICCDPLGVDISRPYAGFPKAILEEASKSDNVEISTPDISEVSTPNNVEAPTPDNVEASTPDNVEAPTPDNVEASTPDNVEAPTLDNVETSTLDNVEASTPDNVEAFTPDNVEAPTPDNVEAPTPDNVEAPTPDNVKASTPDNVKASTPDNVEAPTPDNVEAPTPDNVEAPTPDNVKASTPDNVEVSRPDNVPPVCLAVSAPNDDSALSSGITDTLSNEQTVDREEEQEVNHTNVLGVDVCVGESGEVTHGMETNVLPAADKANLDQHDPLGVDGSLLEEGKPAQCDVDVDGAGEKVEDTAQGAQLVSQGEVEIGNDVVTIGALREIEQDHHCDNLQEMVQVPVHPCCSVSSLEGCTSTPKAGTETACSSKSSIPVASCNNIENSGIKEESLKLGGHSHVTFGQGLEAGFGVNISVSHCGAAGYQPGLEERESEKFVHSEIGLPSEGCDPNIEIHMSATEDKTEAMNAGKDAHDSTFDLCSQDKFLDQHKVSVAGRDEIISGRNVICTGSREETGTAELVVQVYPTSKCENISTISQEQDRADGVDSLMMSEMVAKATQDSIQVVNLDLDTVGVRDEVKRVDVGSGEPGRSPEAGDTVQLQSHAGESISGDSDLLSQTETVEREELSQAGHYVTSTPIDAAETNGSSELCMSSLSPVHDYEHASDISVTADKTLVEDSSQTDHVSSVTSQGFDVTFRAVDTDIPDQDAPSTESGSTTQVCLSEVVSGDVGSLVNKTTLVSRQYQVNDIPEDENVEQPPPEVTTCWPGTSDHGTSHERQDSGDQNNMDETVSIIQNTQNCQSVADVTQEFDVADVHKYTSTAGDVTIEQDSVVVDVVMDSQGTDNDGLISHAECTDKMRSVVSPSHTDHGVDSAGANPQHMVSGECEEEHRIACEDNHHGVCMGESGKEFRDNETACHAELEVEQQSSEDIDTADENDSCVDVTETDGSQSVRDTQICGIVKDGAANWDQAKQVSCGKVVNSALDDTRQDPHSSSSQNAVLNDKQYEENACGHLSHGDVTCIPASPHLVQHGKDEQDVVAAPVNSVGGQQVSETGWDRLSESESQKCEQSDIMQECFVSDHVATEPRTPGVCKMHREREHTAQLAQETLSTDVCDQMVCQTSQESVQHSHHGDVLQDDRCVGDDIDDITGSKTDGVTLQVDGASQLDLLGRDENLLDEHDEKVVNEQNFALVKATKELKDGQRQRRSTRKEGAFDGHIDEINQVCVDELNSPHCCESEESVSEEIALQGEIHTTSDLDSIMTCESVSSPHDPVSERHEDSTQMMKRVGQPDGHLAEAGSGGEGTQNSQVSSTRDLFSQSCPSQEEETGSSHALGEHGSSETSVVSRCDRVMGSVPSPVGANDITFDWVSSGDECQQVIQDRRFVSEPEPGSDSVCHNRSLPSPRDDHAEQTLSDVTNCHRGADHQKHVYMTELGLLQVGGTEGDCVSGVFKLDQGSETVNHSDLREDRFEKYQPETGVHRENDHKDVFMKKLGLLQDSVTPAKALNATHNISINSSSTGAPASNPASLVADDSESADLRSDNKSRLSVESDPECQELEPVSSASVTNIQAMAINDYDSHAHVFKLPSLSPLVSTSCERHSIQITSDVSDQSDSPSLDASDEQRSVASGISDFAEDNDFSLVLSQAETSGDVTDLTPDILSDFAYPELSTDGKDETECEGIIESFKDSKDEMDMEGTTEMFKDNKDKTEVESISEAFIDNQGESESGGKTLKNNKDDTESEGITEMFKDNKDDTESEGITETLKDNKDDTESEGTEMFKDNKDDTESEGITETLKDNKDDTESEGITETLKDNKDDTESEGITETFKDNKDDTESEGTEMFKDNNDDTESEGITETFKDNKDDTESEGTEMFKDNKDHTDSEGTETFKDKDETESEGTEMFKGNNDDTESEGTEMFKDNKDHTGSEGITETFKDKDETESEGTEMFKGNKDETASEGITKMFKDNNDDTESKDIIEIFQDGKDESENVTELFKANSNAMEDGGIIETFQPDLVSEIEQSPYLGENGPEKSQSGTKIDHGTSGSEDGADSDGGNDIQKRSDQQTCDSSDCVPLSPVTSCSHVDEPGVETTFVHENTEPGGEREPAICINEDLSEAAASQSSLEQHVRHSLLMSQRKLKRKSKECPELFQKRGKFDDDACFVGNTSEVSKGDIDPVLLASSVGSWGDCCDTEKTVCSEQESLSGGYSKETGNLVEDQESSPSEYSKETEAVVSEEKSSPVKDGEEMEALDSEQNSSPGAEVETVDGEQKSSPGEDSEEADTVGSEETGSSTCQLECGTEGRGKRQRSPDSDPADTECGRKRSRQSSEGVDGLVPVSERLESLGQHSRPEGEVLYTKIKSMETPTSCKAGFSSSVGSESGTDSNDSRPTSAVSNVSPVSVPTPAPQPGIMTHDTPVSTAVEASAWQLTTADQSSQLSPVRTESSPNRSLFRRDGWLGSEEPTDPVSTADVSSCGIQYSSPSPGHSSTRSRHLTSWSPAPHFTGRRKTSDPTDVDRVMRRQRLQDAVLQELVRLDSDLNDCLANPDMTSAVRLGILEDLETLPITPRLLAQYPQIVHTLEKFDSVTQHKDVHRLAQLICSRYKSLLLS